MQNALISPNEAPIQYVSGWTTDNPPQPIFGNIVNSCRVAQVSDIPFEVASPLFWVTCDDTVTAQDYYYDLENGSIDLIENAPYPSVNNFNVLIGNDYIGNNTEVSDVIPSINI